MVIIGTGAHYLILRLLPFRLNHTFWDSQGVSAHKSHFDMFRINTDHTMGFIWPTGSVDVTGTSNWLSGRGPACLEHDQYVYTQGGDCMSYLLMSTACRDYAGSLGHFYKTAIIFSSFYFNTLLLSTNVTNLLLSLLSLFYIGWCSFLRTWEWIFKTPKGDLLETRSW